MMLRHLTAVVILAITAAGCGVQATPHDSLRVVTTTGVLGDIARNIAGERAEVKTLVPETSDPHSYEPTLHDIRAIAGSDVVLTNGLLLEEQKLIRAIDANLPEKAAKHAVAEEAPRYGARIIPLVEDLSLTTIWLGMRVLGESQESVTLRAVDVQGPGNLAAYLTGTFGQPIRYIDSSDGVDANDVVELPANAHTHMSWAFSTPGTYSLTLEASLGSARLGRATFHFAVGTRPDPAKRALDTGHMDIAANVTGWLGYWGDRSDGQPGSTAYSADDSVIVVPDTALATIPADPAFRFLGKPGTETYQLAQAVLGKHVHGDIDPHMWLDPEGGKAYVGAIRDALSAADPAGASTYQANATAYEARLDEVRSYMATTLAAIPAQARKLVTTHDGFGYLSSAFGLETAGFVTPNPGIQPSTRDSIALNRTLRTLQIPAVFVEPSVAGHSAELIQAARNNNSRVCRIYSEAFDATVSDYITMLATDARNIATCLNPHSLIPPKFKENR